MTAALHLAAGKAKVTRMNPEHFRFEKSGTLVCKRQGRTLVYSWNPKSRLAARLRDLTGVIYDGLSPEAKQAPFSARRQPRTKDKPVIR